MPKKLALPALLVLTFLARQSAAQGPPPEFFDWLPVSAEDRAITSPTVEKDAGAEILVWRVHVLDERFGEGLRRVAYHYVRLKVFDEKGVKSASTIDIPYREPGAVLEVAGRTIKADGSVVELDKKTVFRRDLVRAGREAEKSASFAMPGVEPMAIVEYRWRQTEDDNRFRYLALHFQREYPVRRVTYFVRPLDSKYLMGGEQLYILPLNCKTSPIQMERDNYASTFVENIPAARDEIYSPSTPNTEPWALLYYRQGVDKGDVKKFWSSQGRDLYKDVRESIKSNGDLKTAATAAAAGAKTPDEQITAISTWIQRNVRNVYDPSVTSAERAAFFQKQPRERNRTTSEIIKSGMGTPHERVVLFVGLAGEAGADARPALIASRLEVTFDPARTPDRYFLDNSAAAVKLTGDKWRLVDLNNRFAAPGKLPWYEQGVTALIGDPKEPLFVDTPYSAPDESAEVRNAHLKLSSDGALEGDVEEIISGHRAEERRRAAADQPAAKWEDDVRQQLQRMFPESSVSALQITGVDNLASPIRIKYHLAAPHYAQVTGKRILFQSMPFRRGQGAIFTAADRVNPVEFPYGWRESDEIHIAFPSGFAMDNPTNPGGLEIGALATYSFKMNIVKGETSEVVCIRDFTFGNGGRLGVPVQSYTPLKHALESIQAKDGHTLSVISQ